MITILATYPGRGTTLAADGDPDMRATPGNRGGMDYTGPMTVAAIEAIVQAAYAVIADIQAGSSGFDDDGDFTHQDPRLVAMSYSDGLNAAAAWIANTSVDVHALVDHEGPADSVDRAMVANAYDPLGTRTDPPPVGAPGGAWPTTLDLAGWELWAETTRHVIDYYFRPPAELVDEMPTDGVTVILSKLASTAIRPIWRRWYGNASVYDELTEELRTFWACRQATLNLVTIATSKQCAYVRVQGSYDHAQPDHVTGWNAIKALFASCFGGNTNTYHASMTFWDALNGTDTGIPDPTAAPDLCDCGTWKAVDDLQDVLKWPTTDWIEVSSGAADRSKPLNSLVAWTSHVDLVRWAMAKDFTWI